MMINKNLLDELDDHNIHFKIENGKTYFIADDFKFIFHNNFVVVKSIEKTLIKPLIPDVEVEFIRIEDDYKKINYLIKMKIQESEIRLYKKGRIKIDLTFEKRKELTEEAIYLTKTINNIFEEMLSISNKKNCDF